VTVRALPLLLAAATFTLAMPAHAQDAHAQDVHAGHDMGAMDHAGHPMQGMEQSDPHAGYAMPASDEDDADTPGDAPPPRSRRPSGRPLLRSRAWPPRVPIWRAKAVSSATP
jgi:hypothetical protein